MDVLQLVFTRFNLRPWKGNDPRRHLDPVWLEGRLRVFEAICAPCLRSQTRQDFDWFMLIDPATPAEVRERLQAGSERIQLVELGDPTVGGDVSHHRRMLRELISCRVDDSRPEVVLQSRLDADDGVTAGYFERLRASVRSGETEFLCFRRGYQLDLTTGSAFTRTWSSNAMMSLAQPATRFPVSIADAIHPQVRRVAPLRHLEIPRMWLHVIHGLNVSSRLERGRPVAAGRILTRFEIDPQLLQPRDGVAWRRDTQEWVASGLGVAVELASVRDAVPEVLRGEMRTRRREQRIRALLPQFPGNDDAGYPAEALEALLRAWGDAERLPSVDYLASLLAASQQGGAVVECGGGPATVLLALLGREGVWTVEPDRRRRQHLVHLLAALGLRAQAVRVVSSVASTDLPKRVRVLAVHAPAQEGRGGGYEIFARLVGRLDREGMLLADDARRMLSLPPEALGSITAPLGGVEVVAAKPKPYLRSVGRAGADIGESLGQHRVV